MNTKVIELPSQTQTNTRNRQLILLIAAFLFSLLIHAKFMLTGYGEIDSCILGTLALQWQKTNQFLYYTYPLRTSILYIQTLKMLLSFGLSPLLLPQVMNWINVISGSLMIIPLYWLWQRIADKRAAVIALILLSFAPSFWIGNIYGMPHIPAMLFFCVSLVLFQIYLEKTGFSKYLFWTGALICSILTIGFKADILLCYGAYSGLVFLMHGLNIKKILTSFLLPLLSLIFITTYPNHVFENLKGFSNFSKDWNHLFPFTIKAILDVKNVGSFVFSFGIVLSLVVAIAWLLTVFRREKLSKALFALSWSLPVILFWGLKMGNSARHMTGAVIPLLFYTAIVISTIFKNTKKLIILLLVCLSLNYFICPDTLLQKTRIPSSKIFHAKKHIQRFAIQRHEQGKIFSQVTPPKKVLLGGGNLMYAVWECLKSQDTFDIDRKMVAFKFTDNGTSSYFKRLYREDIDLSLIDKVKSDFPDWHIWQWKSLNNDTINEIVRIQ